MRIFSQAKLSALLSLGSGNQPPRKGFGAEMKKSEEKSNRLALADTYHERTSESAFFFLSMKSAYSASNRSSESPSHFAAFFAVIVA